MIYHISIFRTHNLTISCSKTLVFYSLLSIIQCGLLNTDDINDNFSISWINYIVVLGEGITLSSFRFSQQSASIYLHAFSHAFSLLLLCPRFALIMPPFCHGNANNLLYHTALYL